MKKYMKHLWKVTDKETGKVIDNLITHTKDQFIADEKWHIKRPELSTAVYIDYCGKV